MDSLVEVIVPTFVSPHLFWIIKKKDVLLRCAIKRLLAAGAKNKPKVVEEDDMVMVQVQNICARAVVVKVIIENDEEKYLCWLTDYGILKLVKFVYELDRPCLKYPHIAKQASLYNLVNLKAELDIGHSGYELVDRPTLDEVPGVTTVASEFIESGINIHFLARDEDEYTIYGDIIILTKLNEQKSLSEYLLEKGLMVENEELFNSIDESRDHLIEAYFTPNHSLEKDLDETEKSDLSLKIFNKEENTLFPAVCIKKPTFCVPFKLKPLEYYSLCPYKIGVQISQK